MLGDAFEKFGNMFLEIYELDPDRFLKIPELTLQWALRKTKVKLDLLTDTYVVYGRKKYQRYNMSCPFSICESKICDKKTPS